MKTVTKIFGILTAIAAMSLVYSCDDDVKYTPAEALTNVQAFFSSDAGSTVSISESETSFDVTVCRAKTDESISIALEVTDTSARFSIPSSVSFATGESTTTLTIGYDPADFEYDEYVSVTIKIPEDYATPYGLSDYTFLAGIPAPWSLYDTGDYTYYQFFSGDDPGLSLYRYDNDPTRWKIEHWGYDVDFFFTCDMSTGEVLVDDQFIGYTHSSYGDVWVDDMVDYVGDTSYGQSYYEDGVFYFNVIYYVSAGSFGYGYETFVLSSAVLSDYSVDVSYLGKFTDAGESNYVVVSVTLGDDVESARVALVSGSDITTAVSNIVAGSIDYNEVTESGSLNLPCEESGTYSVVAVSYSDGEDKEYDYVTFNYTLGASDWTSLGNATYTDDYVTTFWGDENLTYEVEIQESISTPGLFRLVNPYGEAYAYNEEGDWDDSMNYYMEIDATDPDGVFINLQNTGMDWGYGDIYVYSYAAYYMDNGHDLDTVKGYGYCGTYADGVITFPTNALLIYMPGYSSSIYYANTNGAFKVVMPDASTESASVKTVKSASCDRTVDSSSYLENRLLVEKPFDRISVR